MDINYVCNDCSKEFLPYDLPYKCSCGGMLNLKDRPLNFSLKEVVRKEWSLFRYLAVLPFKEDSKIWQEASMGEGFTPLVPLDPANPNLMLKMDYMMPTLSFKDRGAVLLMAKAKEFGAKRVVQDSSGNAGNSIAAYASRLGIPCDIYVPKGTSPKKITMIESHGAKVHIIPGSREDTASAALEAVEKGSVFYASHVYNPYFYEGTKTYVYEIYEQMGGKMVDTLLIPVGNGTLLLGAYYGLKELLSLGLIDRLPRIVGVQSENCSPIYQAFHKGSSQVEEVENKGTHAEGIAIAAPKRGGQILQAIRATRGDIILAPEDRILESQKELARRGLYVEITTAATLAAYKDYVKDGKDLGRVVLPLCGAGLKSS